MKPELKRPLAAIVLVGGTILATPACESQPEKQPAKPQEKAAAKDPGTIDPAAMMQKMMELAQPGAPHQELAKKVGTWEQHYKMRMDPEGPWQEFDGQAEIKPLLGGRYVMEDVSFSMMGMPMQGMQLIGYDNMSQEYVALWADTMSTWWVTARGKKGADGTIEMKGTMVDVMGPRPYRMVMHPKGDDESETEMYDTIPPKGETLVMTITSKRKK